MGLNNSVFHVQDYTDVFSFIYVYYGNYLYTVRYDKETGNTVLMGTNSSTKILSQEDMDNIATICFDYYQEKGEE